MHEKLQSDLATAAVDREQKLLVNFEKKIAIVDKLLEMYAKFEPNAVINLVGHYIERPMLPESKNIRLPNKGIQRMR
jgi:hypothetical protein